MLPLHQRSTNLVRGKGIEPLTERWQRSVLPLNEPRIVLVADEGFEPSRPSL